jgi:CheY-like chemotaxis protein
MEKLVRSSAGFALSGSNIIPEILSDRELWPCDADPQQISQVVDNLLINARQAMPAGGTISIRLENVSLSSENLSNLPEGFYVRLSIRDQGPGIPHELQSRIFEPFFTTKAGGTGLGLAIVYSIVRRHGGNIEVESKSGSGTSFKILLPATPGNIPSHRTQPSVEVISKLNSGSGGRILVMDDEEYIRKMTGDALKHLGYDVVPACNDREALDIARRSMETGEHLDAAILDITIPGGMGGIEVLQHMRQILPGLPIIASSGYSGDDAIARPADYGFNGALPKPYTLANLGILLSEVIESARATRSPSDR